LWWQWWWYGGIDEGVGVWVDFLRVVEGSFIIPKKGRGAIMAI